MTWQHPVVGVIAPIKLGDQPKKVWRHLYSPMERWSSIIGCRTDTLYAAAVQLGCPPWTPNRWRAPFPEPCRSLMRTHHDEAWSPAYAVDLLEPRSLVGRDAGDRRWLFASPRGVYLVATAAVPSRIVTAMRPHPLGLNVTWTDENFVVHAADRWRRNTGMTASSLAEELRQAASATSAANEIWRLALLVGRARWSSDPEIASARKAAEDALASLPAATSRAALPNATEILDSLEEGVRDESDDVEGLLLDVEDALVVTEVVAGREAAQRLLDEASHLLEWAPEAWSDLGALCHARKVATAGLAASLWNTVEDAVASRLLRAMPGTSSMEATVASSLLAPSFWDQWMERLSSLPDRLRSFVSIPEGAFAPLGWEQDCVLGADSPWKVLPPAELRDQAGLRLFGVDASTPNGCEVTSQLHSGTIVWTLQPGDDGWMFWVTGVDEGNSLAEVIELAERTPGSTLTLARVSRPR